ncbi:MAG TPA: tRNA pseudouridine(38-40) synthase TruA [Myxococcaceae bacterium]|nr:tRNA pseudouridine(38-40) synthase TruA [Myxococcaceae bacterium]
MPRVRLTLEYDGTDFVGWQRQLNGRSVQEVLERALGELLGAPVAAAAAGRTDSGVHALGQVVAFDAPRALPGKAYVRGLSSLLPADLAVVAAEEVPDTFDPRRWATGKRYRYLVSRRASRAPLLRRTHWEVFTALDVGAMRASSAALLGTHDFSSFRAADCEAPHPRRTLRTLTLHEDSDVLRLEVEGTAFLKHMVRNVVGSLVEVGRGKRPPGWIAEVLAAKDRTLAGPTAPAHGLTLVEVSYGEGTRPPAGGGHAPA